MQPSLALITMCISLFLQAYSILVAEGAELAQVVRLRKDGMCAHDLAERIVQYLNNNGQPAATLAPEDDRGCHCAHQSVCIWHLLQETQSRYGIEVELNEKASGFHIEITIYDNKDRTSGHYGSWDVKPSDLLRELPIKAAWLLQDYRSRAQLTSFRGVASAPARPLDERRRRTRDAIGVSLSVLAATSLAASFALMLKHGEPIDAMCPRIPLPRPCVLDTFPFFVSGYIGSAVFAGSAGLILGFR